MYYQDTLKIIKKQKDWISSTQLFELYKEVNDGQGSRLNFNRALAKLRRRDDVDWQLIGRTYEYKHNSK